MRRIPGQSPGASPTLAGGALRTAGATQDRVPLSRQICERLLQTVPPRRRARDRGRGRRRRSSIPVPCSRVIIAEQSAQPCEDAAPLGRLVATLPLSRAGGLVQPFGVKIGGPGLDARLNTDLSGLQPDRLITPTEQVYVRTECPPAVAAHRGPWTIKTSGLVARAAALPLDDVSRQRGRWARTCSSARATTIPRISA